MKQFLSRWKALSAGVLLLAGLLAYAGSKVDPLAVKLESVSRELFGKGDPWNLDGSRVTGLFSPQGNEQVPTVPILNHPAYTTAINHVKELKRMIEEESGKRSHLDYSSTSYQVLVEVAAKYVEIQKALFLNFASNVHELGVSRTAFDVDSLNLRVESGVGSQLMLQTELQKKFNIRHLPGDPTLGQAELFLSAYDRMQIEIAALSKVKTKAEYQRLIHLMHLRDSLVNRWSIRRVFSSAVQSEIQVNPPSAYLAFAEDRTSRPSEFLFSRDLRIEDQYEERITRQIDALEQVLANHPLASPMEYGKMVRQFYDSFPELKGVAVDAEAVVGNLYHVEETTLAHSARQVILESNFPQDSMSPEAIAERIAVNAYRVRKAAILTTLIRRIKIDLAAWRGFLEPDANGMVSEADIDRAQEYIKLSPDSVQQAENAIDPVLNGLAAGWKRSLATKIRAHYQTALPGGETAAASKRYGEFLDRVLNDSIDGVLGAKQVKVYDAIRKKLEAIPSKTAESLSSAGVPLTSHCFSSGMGYGSCTYSVNANAYLSRLDAEADLGMSWVVPWTPGQVAELFSKKLENIEKIDSAGWGSISAAAKDQNLMKEIGKFFEELNKAHQEAIQIKQKGISQQILAQSNALAKQLTARPDLDIRGTQTFQKIQALNDRMLSVGQNPDESVLTEAMYQAAAHRVFSAYLAKISTPPPAPPTPTPAPPGRIFPSRWETISPRDATSIKPTISPVQITPFVPGKEKRSVKAIELGKLFSLLGFGQEFFSRYSKNPNLMSNGKAVNFVTIGGLLAKPYPAAAARMGNVVKTTPRKPKVSALSEMSRTAAGQKFLAEAVMADVYTRVPFLRIQGSDDDESPTGLERLEPAYSAKTGWNRTAANNVFIELLRTAIRNDHLKVEDAVVANPNLPAEDERFKKVFRSQAHNRSLFISSAGSAKGRVEGWDQSLKKETRTTAEKWNDRMSQIAGVLFIASMIFLLWEFLPMLIPALGAVVPSASVVFSSFSVLGMSGSVIAGFLSGSNLLVQMFFMATIAAQGQVAFFTLPAQLKYQKELANSTVGMTSSSQRIVAPAERVSRENIRGMQEEIRTAKIVTGVMAAVQTAFLPLQIKQVSRVFGSAGRVALLRLGETNPALAESMKSYSLSQLVERFGYAKGSKMYLQHYSEALLSAKPLSAVNGGATVVQAQQLLAESLSTKLSHSSEVGALFEARLQFLKEEILRLQESSKKYFAITQGAKKKYNSEALKQFFGKELSAIGFHLEHPQVKIHLRERIARTMEAEGFSAIEAETGAALPLIEKGSQKYLLKAFLLRMKAEKLMMEAMVLKRFVEQLKTLEMAQGGAVGTAEVFAEFSGVANQEHLGNLLKWAAKHPEYEGTAFGQMLRDARQSLKDFRLVADDIARLSHKDRALYDAMNGNADVVVNDDLTLTLGDGKPVESGDGDFFVIPGLSMGLSPQ